MELVTGSRPAIHSDRLQGIVLDWTTPKSTDKVINRLALALDMEPSRVLATALQWLNAIVKEELKGNKVYVCAPDMRVLKVFSTEVASGEG